MKTFLAQDHEIDHSQIDADALFVIDKLKEAGHAAYLVGGGVRDLLARRPPKDFDISTSAKPEEIKQIFKRSCILIGRRFRLAHIRFGHKVIEVATFRSGENDSDLIVRDNTWGTEEEDVMRRDFTINGLLYDPTTREVIDYVGGWEDLKKKTLRTIGDPATRFKQDPVRMIRLLKFRARYGLEIEQETKQALINCRIEIVKSSPARILEEMLRMLESGAAARFFHLLLKSGLLGLIFPSLEAFIQKEEGQKIYRLLEMADQMHQKRKSKPLDRSLLVACLIFPILEQEVALRTLQQGAPPHQGEITTLSAEVTRAIIATSFSHFPRRISTLMNSLMAMQYRLKPLAGGKRPSRTKLFASKDFPLALTFLQLHSAIDKEWASCYQSWKAAYMQHHQQQTHRGHAPHPAPSRRRNRRPANHS